MLLGRGSPALLALVDRLGSDVSLPVELVGQYATSSATIDGRTLRSSPAAPLPEPELPKLAAAISSSTSTGIAPSGAVRTAISASTLAASRGSSFRCDWCAEPIGAIASCQRSAADVAAEMLSLKRDYAPDHVWFADNIFGFRVDWVRDFAAALVVERRRRCTSKFSSPKVLVDGMAAALPRRGIPRGTRRRGDRHPEALDAMHKGTPFTDIGRARQRARCRNVYASSIFLMLGYVGEEARRHPRDPRPVGAYGARQRIGVSVAYRLPGTKLYDLVKRRVRREAQLGREQRPRHDVLRNLSLGVLPQRCAICCTTRSPKAREAVGHGSGGGAVNRKRQFRRRQEGTGPEPSRSACRALTGHVRSPLTHQVPPKTEGAANHETLSAAGVVVPSPRF